MLWIGYIGLTTASLLANNGFEVVGVDKKVNLIGIVNDGVLHIEEHGLKALVHAAVNSGLLKATTVAEEADVLFHCCTNPCKRI